MSGRKLPLTTRFIAGSKFGWWMMFWLYNIHQPVFAYRHFKGRYPWVVCERIPRKLVHPEDDSDYIDGTDW